MPLSSVVVPRTVMGTKMWPSDMPRWYRKYTTSMPTMEPKKVTWESGAAPRALGS